MPNRRKKRLELWFAKPLKFTILQILEEYKGRITLTDLIKELSNIYENISINQINRTLMTLEIEGEIHVEVVGPNERIIEKIEKGRVYLPITED